MRGVGKMRKLLSIILLCAVISIILPIYVIYGAEPHREAISLQDAFVSVSKEVGPSVVSISTERIEHYQTRYYPFSRFQDQFFDEFFNDFFVVGPEREFRRLGLGSGVIIDKEGYILTNEHVIHGADKIKVTLSDGREFEGQLTGSDVYSDLAVVKIEPKGNLPFAKLGNSDNVQIGQWAVAIGNPFAFAVKNPEPTITVGVISALHRSLPRTDRRDREYSDLIQTDAAINPGNSGGPLVNIYGEVIGINVAIFTMSGGSEGIGFAIPVNTAKKVMNNLMQGKKVLYGWIGVMIQDIDANLAAYFGLKENSGVLISRIVENSPAIKAGLLAGDIIIAIDNQKVKNTQDLIRIVLKKEIGEKVSLAVIREGIARSTIVEIGERPEEKEMALEGKTEKTAPITASKFWRGIEVSEITPEIAERFKLKTGSGVIVVNIEPGSASMEAGIKAGDIIYEINRIPVKNISDYQSIISKVRGDVLVGTYRGYVMVREK